MNAVVDLRRHPRREFIRRGAVQILSADSDARVSVPAIFETLSRRGAGLWLDGPLPVSLLRGSIVELCFFSAAKRGSQTTRVPARVVWTDRERSRMRLGTELLLEFVSDADAQSFQRLVDSEGEEDERDTTPRAETGDG